MRGRGTYVRGQETIEWAGVSTPGGTLPQLPPMRPQVRVECTDMACPTCGAPTIAERVRTSRDGQNWTVKVVHRCTRHNSWWNRCPPVVEVV